MSLLLEAFDAGELAGIAKDQAGGRGGERKKRKIKKRRVGEKVYKPKTGHCYGVVGSAPRGRESPAEESEKVRTISPGPARFSTAIGPRASPINST